MVDPFQYPENGEMAFTLFPFFIAISMGKLKEKL